MLSRERILKLDILTPDNTKILSASNKHFSLPIVTNNLTGQSETVLIIKGHDIPEVEHNSELFVITHMKSGERVKYPGFVSLSTDFQLNVLLRTARAQVLEERRRYFKVDTDIQCIVNSVERGGRRIPQTTPATARIKDLNVGGVFLCFCNEDYRQDDKLLITMDMGNRMVDVTAEIIRVQFNAAGEPAGYGCRFVNVPPAMEELFARFVYKVQLDNIRKEEEEEEEMFER